MPSRAASSSAASVGHLAARRVDEVAEDREVDARIDVGQRRHLEPLEQFLDLGDRGQQHRNDDHRAGVWRQPVLELETQQPSRADEQRHEPLHDDNRHFARRHQQQQRRPRAAAPADRPALPT